MRGLERNVKLAARSAGKITMIVYGASFLMAAWFAFLGGIEIHTVSDAVSIYLYMAALMGTGLIMGYMAFNMTTDFQQALAYGSTRKCAAIGMIFFAVIMSLMQTTVNALLYMIAAMVFPKIVFELYVLFEMLVNYLMIVGIGILTGAVVFRFGKIGYYVIMFGMGSAVGLTAYAYLSTEHIGSQSMDLSPLLAILKVLVGTSADMGIVYLLALITGVVLIVLAGILLVHVTKQAEVRV